jgi:hypothetical protein
MALKGSLQDTFETCIKVALEKVYARQDALGKAYTAMSERIAKLEKQLEAKP